MRELVAHAAGAEAPTASSSTRVEDKDWVNASLEDLVPVHAGRFLVHGSHDRDRVPPNKIGIEIEAALAFGTGHHGTTRGCLLLLDEVLRRWRPAACSISAPAPACWGLPRPRRCDERCSPAISIRRSVEVARDNARLNRAGNLVQAVRATASRRRQFPSAALFDLVLANILANPLRRWRCRCAASRAAALVILSGLLPPQANGVIAAYRAAGWCW